MATAETTLYVHDKDGDRGTIVKVGEEIPSWAHGVEAPAAEPVAPINESVPVVEPVGESEVARPPKAGAGSSREAWAAYADSAGVEYAADAKQSDIVAAVEAAESE